MAGDGVADSPNGVVGQARAAKASGWAQTSARIGLGSRALVYGTLAIIVARIAAGGGDTTGSDTDQGSSLQVFGRSPAGVVVLVALAVGVVCYAVWRASEAWLGGADPGGHVALARVQALIEGVAYLPFGYVALAVAFGDDQAARQGQNYRSLSAGFLTNQAGQALVAVVGAVVVGVGVFFVVQGWRRTFLGHFDFSGSSVLVRRLTTWLGVVGCAGRGLMFVLAGGLVIYAGVTAEPSKAGGIDAALDVLARQRFGRVLLALAAAGFGAFALYALCEARWRRT